MNKRPSKSEVRDQINSEVEAFLRDGGQVKELARGETGLVNCAYNDRSLGFEKPKEERTPVDHVLQTIDQRRQDKRKPVPSKPKRRGPRKKVIYDDFGEPVRVIWED